MQLSPHHSAKGALRPSYVLFFAHLVEYHPVLTSSGRRSDALEKHMPTIHFSSYTYSGMR